MHAIGVDIGGTKIAAGPMFFDWEPMRALQARAKDASAG